MSPPHLRLLKGFGLSDCLYILAQMLDFVIVTSGSDEGGKAGRDVEAAAIEMAPSEASPLSFMKRRLTV